MIGRGHGCGRWLGWVAVVLASCSSMDVGSDWDPRASFADLHTWNWISPEPGPGGGDARAENPLLHQRIEEAIESELAARGYRKSEAAPPDFWIGYHVAIEHKIDPQQVYQGYGVGPYRSYGTPSGYAEHYDVGTLLIDVVRAAPREVVWRGWAQSRVQELKDPTEREARAREAVSRILARFPPNGAGQRAGTPAVPLG